MSFKISLVHRANIHIAQAIEWCSKQEQNLEIRFLKSLDNSITYIQKNPFKSQIRYRNVRVKFMRNPKFGVHYNNKRSNHLYNRSISYKSGFSYLVKNKIVPIPKVGNHA